MDKSFFFPCRKKVAFKDNCKEITVKAEITIQEGKEYINENFRVYCLEKGE